MEFDFEILHQIHKDMPRQGAGRNKYTQKAYEMIPRINKPKILDIGCGPGMQTIKLAKMSDGNVIGIDVFEQYLDQLRELIKKENLEDRVKAENMSMTEINYPEKSFDIIWAEGSIFIIGFEKGLLEWKKFVKDKGFIAIHDMAYTRDDPPKELEDFWQSTYPDIKTVSENIEIIKKSGYKVLGHFPLPDDAWWEFYYNPLQKRLKIFKEKFKDNPKGMEFIKFTELEMEMHKKYNKWYASVFYVMQKL